MILYLILHNIRSVHNVGSIFRTADAAGVTKLYLTGYTPTPLDRFGRPRKDMAKVALGAERTVPWERYASAAQVLRILRKQGVHLVAVEQAKDAIDYRKVKARSAIAFLLGNETSGLPKALQRLCDTVTEIPMHGKKESLNVSVAAGIILFTTRK
ncbi:MAG: TrmH family RNA methyltransferase [bacterium]|nr:TrmH family RNA methyltransferase [bacterium]